MEYDSKREAHMLLNLYDSWDADRRKDVQRWFGELAAAYPHKRRSQTGMTDLWLTAIVAARDGISDWL
jgi:hypothetical protein